MGKAKKGIYAAAITPIGADGEPQLDGLVNATGVERKALQAALTDFRLTIQKFPLIAAVKQVQAWRTKDAQWLRTLPPLRNLSPAQTTALKSEMQRLGQISRDQDAA
jgi:4-hydroxy-tetrahydrodipicolinate synthase